MWREAVLLPHLLHRGDGETAGGGRGACRPVGRLLRRLALGQADHRVVQLRLNRRASRRAGLAAQEPIHALVHEVLLTAPDSRLGDSGLPHDGIGARSCGSEVNDAGPPDLLLRRVAVGDERLEAAALVDGDGQGNTGAHPADTHTAPTTEIPSQDYIVPVNPLGR